VARARPRTIAALRSVRPEGKRMPMRRPSRSPRVGPRSRRSARPSFPSSESWTKSLPRRIRARPSHRRGRRRNRGASRAGAPSSAGCEIGVQCSSLLLRSRNPRACRREASGFRRADSLDGTRFDRRGGDRIARAPRARPPVAFVRGAGMAARARGDSPRACGGLSLS